MDYYILVISNIETILYTPDKHAYSVELHNVLSSICSNAAMINNLQIESQNRFNLLYQQAKLVVNNAQIEGLELEAEVDSSVFIVKFKQNILLSIKKARYEQ